jgi:hypothetical protein
VLRKAAMVPAPLAAAILTVLVGLVPAGPARAAATLAHCDSTSPGAATARQQAKPAFPPGTGARDGGKVARRPECREAGRLTAPAPHSS